MSERDKNQGPSFDEVPESRLARLGALSAKVGGKLLSGAARRLFSSSEKAEQQKKETHEGAAKTIVESLGQMKGLAMKIGQMLSYVDGALPTEMQEVYRSTLGSLQSKAPPLPYHKVREAIIRELGDAPEKLFEGFEEEPCAAASIGQVHRARLDGVPVAVKVQYPGIDRAIDNELKDAKMLEKMFAPLAKRVGANQAIDEISARVREELDYRLEANTQDRFREAFAYWPEVIVPKVYRHRSTQRVLTSEFIEGRNFHQLCEQLSSQEERDRVASVMFRFVFEAVYTHSLFNGDPHPGNYLFPNDGRVAFLDYGCSINLSAEDVTILRDTHLAHFAGDIPRAYDLMLTLFEVDRSKKVHVEAIQDYTDFIFQPYKLDEPFLYSREYAREAFSRAGQLFKKTLTATGSVPTSPGRLTFLNRMQWGFLSILASLGGRVNSHRILHEIFEKNSSTPATIRA
jgi:predicted unusual protein kinase regulating ubiquinone biosynthesis (AarF/ABC1/UbiB family)